MSLRARLARLMVDCRGAALIEFAFLAPAFIIMLFGVLQLGLALQSYNAMRSMSADVARYAMVQKAAGNGGEVTAAKLEAHAETIGIGSPYLLNNGLNATVTPVATPRVAGITELTLTVDYKVRSIIEPWGVKGPTLVYERPIFLSN